MCGIIGYVGQASAAPILIDGLKRLEYRGYDSSGLAVLSDSDSITLRKKSGEPSDENAHPHLDQSGRLALVHNGVIENYQTLKDHLLKEGHTFSSQTDSEVLVHLIGRFYEGSEESDLKVKLIASIREALKQVSGTYGIAVMHAAQPRLRQCT